MVPSKLDRKFNTDPIPEEKKISVLSEDLAYLFMKVIAQLCYNTVNFCIKVKSIKEWFYKLCPLKSATQTLNYKKKDEEGREYTESFNIGTNNNNNDVRITNKTNKSSIKHNSIRKTRIPYFILTLK